MSCNSKLYGLHSLENASKSLFMRAISICILYIKYNFFLNIIFRINFAIEAKSQVPENDIRQLKQELVPVFVVCLQQDR